MSQKGRVRRGGGVFGAAFGGLFRRAALPAFLALSLCPSAFPQEAPPADPLGLESRAAALIDASTGDLLYAKNPDEPIPPASLAKLMTIHVAARLAARRGVSLDAPVPLPPESWAVNQPPRSSLMFLAQGQTVSLRELFLGLAIPSGNDAAVAVALRFAPSVSRFAALMNGEAARLGLSVTRFVEPSGIDEHNLTTAAEFARFCREYIARNPENLAAYHTVPEFAYPKSENVSGALKKRPGTVVQANHISILRRYPGADGLKTGYIDEAGYNLAATAERDGTRLIAVLLGVPADFGPRRADRARTDDAIKLFDYGYANFKTARFDAPPLPGAKIWKGRKNRAGVSPAGPLVWTIPRARGLAPDIRLRYIPGLCAPLERGAKAGTLTVYDEAGELGSVDLVLNEAAEAAGPVKRFFHGVALLFQRR